MRKKRTEIYAGLYQDARVGEILLRNTYGGSRENRTEPRQMPVVSAGNGIMMEWKDRTDRYPNTITLRMTDGKWIKYRIEDETEETAPAGGGRQRLPWAQGCPRKAGT